MWENESRQTLYWHKFRLFNKKLSGCYSILQWVFFSISVCFLLFLSDNNFKKAWNRTSKTISKYLTSGSNNSNNFSCLLMIVNGDTKEFFGKREKGWLEVMGRNGYENWKYVPPEDQVHKSECQENIRELVHNHSFANCIKKFWLVMRHQILQSYSIFRSQMMAAVITENE